MQRKPNDASHEWVSEEDLIKWAEYDNEGKLVKLMPYRMFRAAGKPDIVYRPDLDKYYFAGGGEPISIIEVDNVYPYAMPDPEKVALEKKRLQDEKEKAKILKEIEENKKLKQELVEAKAAEAVKEKEEKIRKEEEEKKKIEDDILFQEAEKKHYKRNK